ncbi:cytochrome P450 [Auricularia subglabra TFB-10046 SS5]|nr:cytochrome P450 [Auricularia subglabra TFB-10046 SS5]
MYAVCVLAGLLAHLVCHRVNPRALTALCALVFLPPLTLFVASLALEGTWPLARLLLCYLAALSSSVVLYRLSPFHPLARYPGPVLARVSGFWAVLQAFDGKQHVVYRRLHERYGEVVRTGPNHLHLCNASAVQTVLGARNQWHKPDGYEVPLPPGHVGSVLTLTNPVAHSARKRVWERAFTRAALGHYQPMFVSRRAEFKAAMDARCGAVINMSEWLAFFTLDFMGDFALGGMFDFMAQGDDTLGFHRTLVRAMGLTDLCSKISWVRAFIHLFPGPLDSFLSAARDIARKRKEIVADRKDLFYYLLDENAADVPTIDTLAQDALVAVIAGSDTSSTILVNAVFYLAVHPRVLTTLRQELHGVMALEDEVEWGALAECEYLQAVINETMRLAPVLPNGPPRTPPPGGRPVVVAGHVVPTETIVYIPFYSLFRDARYFSPDPDAFRPERWLCGGRLDDVLDQRAFIPFSYGPTACAGRQLAQHEVRDMLALLVHRYDIALAPGYDPARWEADWEDRYVLVPGRLPVVLTRRRA